METTIETLAVGGLVETRLGHRYRIIRIMSERNLVVCESLRWPQFSPYTFHPDSLQRIEDMTCEEALCCEESK